MAVQEYKLRPSNRNYELPGLITNNPKSLECWTNSSTHQTHEQPCGKLPGTHRTRWCDFRQDSNPNAKRWTVFSARLAREEQVLSSDLFATAYNEPQKTGQARLPATKLTNVKQAQEEENNWEEG